MRVLLDHCVDVRLVLYLERHEVTATKDLGWENLSNGALLSAAETEGFQAFITVDKNLRHQQNVSKLRLAVLTLASRYSALEDIVPLVPAIQGWLDRNLAPGSDVVIGAGPG